MSIFLTLIWKLLNRIMEIIKINSTNRNEIIQKTVEVLKKGGLVVYPTETCYGVGVDSTNPQAVDNVLHYKTKRADKPLSIAVSDKEMAECYGYFNQTAHNIFDNYLPGPITVVVKGLNKVAPGVQSSTGTVGFRWPDYPLITDIIRTFGKPITATSANVSYKKTPYSVDDILENISDRQHELLDLIIDAGTLPKRKTSTVIDTTLEGIHILREGDFLFKDCRDFVSNSEEETEQFAKKILAEIKEGIGKKLIVVELYGDLGAGKTYFSKFFTKHIGLEENVVSPTFTLCNEYILKHYVPHIYIFHIDAYRMYQPEELDDLGADRMFISPNIILIEWANKVSKYISHYLDNAILIKIKLEHIAPSIRNIQYSISGIERSNQPS